MVNTRATSDALADDPMKLWVAEQLSTVMTSLNERIDSLMQNSRSGEGTSRFSRMGKLEFPKFYGEDVQGWLFRVKQFFDVDMCMRKIRSRWFLFIFMIRH